MNQLKCATCPDLCALKFLASTMEEAATDAEAALGVAKLQANMARQANEEMELKDKEEEIIREITGDRPRQSMMEHAGLREIAYHDEGAAYRAVIEAINNHAIADQGGTMILAALKRYIVDMQSLCQVGEPIQGFRVPIIGAVVPFPFGSAVQCSSGLRNDAPHVFYDTAGMFPQTANLTYADVPPPDSQIAQ